MSSKLKQIEKAVNEYRKQVQERESTLAFVSIRFMRNHMPEGVERKDWLDWISEYTAECIEITVDWDTQQKNVN